MYTLLVVEDDVELNQTISEVLSGEGYRVLRAHSCREAQRLADSHTLDLAVLDVNLPDGDGFSLCKWLKGRQHVSVLFLSARDLEEDVLEGYELGAAAYVTKPVSIKILLKKISVILAREPEKKQIYDDGFLKIDFDAGTVCVGEKVCPVTPTEYKILKKLVEHKGKLLTYSVLLDSLWDEGVQLMDKHALTVNINRLRKKLEAEGHTYISNVYGMGYIWK